MRLQRTLKDFVEQMRETRAGRLAAIGLILYLCSGLLVIAYPQSAARWISVIPFVTGNVAFIFAGLNIIRIEFDFMPRFLRGREE